MLSGDSVSDTLQQYFHFCECGGIALEQIRWACRMVLYW